MRQDIVNMGFKEVATCPLAPAGSPVTMSKASFEKMCKAQQGKQKNGYPINSHCYYDCQGNNKPETITFNDNLIKELNKKRKGEAKLTVKSPVKKKVEEVQLTCELCGEKKSNIKHKEEIDLKVCTSCIPLVGASKYRPGSLLKALAIYNEDKALVELEEAKATINSLRKELDVERSNKEKEGVTPANFFKGASNEKTVTDALKISEADVQKLEVKNRDLMTENAKLENNLGIALEESRKLREDLAGLNTTLANRNSLLVANGNVLAKMRERGDIAFTLAEAVACEGSLLISQESILKIRGALS